MKVINHIHTHGIISALDMVSQRLRANYICTTPSHSMNRIIDSAIEQYKLLKGK